MKLIFSLWERHLAAMIVAGSHSHKGDASSPIEWRRAPHPASFKKRRARMTGTMGNHSIDLK
jgi:hypothetical protein